MTLAGVMGWPVGHSLSPLIHRFWLEALGVEGEYVRLAVRPERLAAALAALAPLGFAGVNVTVPHKVAAMAYLDRLDAMAKAVGAVNLVRVAEDGSLEGSNTDVEGVREALAGWTGGQVVLVGAGGAARAAVVALRDLGASRLIVLNRTRRAAEELVAAAGLPGTVGDLAAPLPPGTSLLVNASSLGMRGQPAYTPDLRPLGPGAMVFDMVYAPLATPLVQAARAKGLAVRDGLLMLVGQARAAFRTLFRADPPRDRDAELRQRLLAACEPGPRPQR
ncbi:MAG: shikimate dehydrogenase [Sphingomonadaceae bacterium]|uniref:shikimate dehydrogenase n=1 Tax=Thermaurantiacus sp. TaxID=2820283 RepID=UPI00298EFDB1|nr:shikimate dehydrogenase [Thermaurantiacus sp.]MCS6987659.1 shikimate dehydrogenase [Sphingomonadaceae bacterium]MDW8415260.1 shikimate dehydrogenase [Thermaurantiacus sp.]